MEQKDKYNWFLIMCSWDSNADKDALKRFGRLYDYLDIYPDRWDKLPDEDPRKALDIKELKALNLIGQRKFVIIGRTRSNRVLQKISSDITLETAIRVEVFPATYVREFKEVNADRL